MMRINNRTQKRKWRCSRQRDQLLGQCFHQRPPAARFMDFCFLSEPIILLLITLFLAQNSHAQQQYLQQEQVPPPREVNFYNQSLGYEPISWSSQPDGGTRPRRFAGANDDSSSSGGSNKPTPSTSSMVWDFGQARPSLVSGSSVAANQHWLAPRFALEPPSLVEYSNSTGTVIPCRPQTVLASGPGVLSLDPLQQRQQQQQQQQQVVESQRRLASAAPVSISWHLVSRLPGELLEGGATGNQEEGSMGSVDGHGEQLVGTNSDLRAVRPDGALVFSPFKAPEFRQNIHKATYRCCLANRFGQLCSRPVRTRAVIDSAPNLEVFDEFVLAGNSVILRCQAPSHLDKYLDHLAWLKDDKSIVTRQTQLQFEAPQFDDTQRFNSNTKPLPRRLPNQMSGHYNGPLDSNFNEQQWPLGERQKYLMLQTGELLIRRASKSDAASYKCRARHRLTGALITSNIGGQLMVDDTSTKSSLRPTGSMPLIWSRENSDLFICARFQSLPEPNYTWFWQASVQPGAERRPIGQETPDIRLLQPQATCLFVQQAQQRHSGLYTCEANNGDATQTSTTRLVVGSAQLTAQLLVQQMTTTSNLKEQQQRLLTTAPSNLQIVQLGSNLHLNCSITGYPYELIGWFKDSKLIGLWSAQTNDTSKLWLPTNQRNTKSTHNNIKLVQQTVISIENFGLNDRGVYQCQVYSSRTPNVSEFASSATTSGGAPYPPPSQPPSSLEGLMERDYLRSASASVQLDIAFSKPMLSVRFQSQTVPKGSSVSLQCGAVALPRARILWFLDNQPIGSLRPAEPSDLAPEMAETSDFSLISEAVVGDAPFFSSPSLLPAAYTTMEQTLADLKGQKSNGGDNADEIMVRNYQPYEQTIGGDDRFQITTHLMAASATSLGHPLVMSQLNISQVLGSETGQYKCLAINALGYSQHSAQINVLGGGIELRHYQPTNVTLIAGRPAQLQCPLVGYPLARVDWFRNDQRLPSSHRQRIELVKAGVGGQLELSNVDRSADAGLYSCRASLGPSSSAAADQQRRSQSEDLVGQLNVVVRVAPLIDSQSLPEVVQTNEGMRTKLVCSVVQGDHPVEIRWLRRASDRSKVALVGRLQLAGLELMQNSNTNSDNHEESITIHNLEDSCLLTFKQISYADSADYLCLAQNDIGQAVRWTRVIVNVAPSWSTELASDLNVMLGARLQLECLAHGFPTPTVTWKYQAGLSGRQSSKSGLDPTQAQEQQEQTQEAPQQQQQATQNEYTDLVVSNFRQRIHSNGSLIIDQVEQLDGGSYMCEVANGIGTGLSKILRVKVNIPPYFRQRTGVQLGQIGGRTELKCLAYGDQPMVIGWRKDGDIVDLLNHDNRHRLVQEYRVNQQAHESVLTIQNLARNDSGQYVCVASNEFGTEETRLQFLVQEPPEAPVLMRPIRAGSRQATLSFKAPYTGNSPIRKYAILFKQVATSGQPAMGMLMSDPLSMANDHLIWASNMSSKQDNTTQLVGWQQVVVDAPPNTNMMDSALATPMTRGNFSESNLGQLVNLNLCCLQPYSRYMVRVRAINDIGPSESSKVIHLVTDEEAIGGPPLDVGVETTGAHSLKVRWRAPARNMQNGLIRGYYIGYRATNPSLMAGPNGGGANGALEVLQQQRSGSPIQQVPGVNGPSVKVMEGPADGEQYQYKNVQLDFSAPNFLELHSAGTGGGGGGATSNENDPPLNTTLRLANQIPQIYTSYLTNLRRKTAYSIIVQAYNKIGAGPRSDQIIVSTLDAAPPMSPILKLVSVSYNSALLTWSGRRFSLDNNSLASSNHQQHRVFAFGESLMDDDGEEEDDPHSYYTLNFRTDDPLRGVRGPPISSQNEEDWQQRRLLRRQPLPYVLNNLKCGSHHTAFMTATNSLGQSEPGESIRFTTVGAAPIAPSNARDFLHVNSTCVLLRLGAWQGAGCTIGSFLFKYRASNQMKWTIVEHQVHPTIQTVTIAGSALFSTRPLVASPEPGSAGANPSDQRGLADSTNHKATNKLQQQQQQANGDFVIRNLLAGVTYRLVVEANSEAGATVAEYEFDTANFSASTISISINGISASEIQQRHLQLDATEGRTNSLDGGPHTMDGIGGPHSSNSELDFSHSGGQRSASFVQRYTFGVWSLTALFVVASVLMASTALILGLRSVIRMKPSQQGTGSKQRASTNQGPLSSAAMLCCLSSAASSSSGGADSNSSSGGGTCYQVSEHPLEAYCSQLPAGHGLQMLSASETDATPTRDRGGAGVAGHAGLGSVSNSEMMIDNVMDGGELKSIMGLADTLPFRQLVSSSSLSTIGARLGAGNDDTNPNLATCHQRNTHTLARASHCQRRFSSHKHQEDLIDPAGGHQFGAANHFRAAQYAATLGKQHSNFMQQSSHLQPLKYNDTIYGRLQGTKNHQQNSQVPEHQQQHYAMNTNNYNQMFHEPSMSSSGTTSGYETGPNSAPRLNGSVDDAAESLCVQSQAPVYLQTIDSSYQQQQQQQQMSMYDQSGLLPAPNTAESNLFNRSANNHRVSSYEHSETRGQDHGQFHYNVPSTLDGKTNLGSQGRCQQGLGALEPLTTNDYGMLFGTANQIANNQQQQQQDLVKTTRLNQNFQQQQQESLNHLHQLLNNNQHHQQ